MATSPAYRQIPSVDKLLGHPLTRELVSEYGVSQTTHAMRDVTQAMRQELQDGERAQAPSMEALIEAAEHRLAVASAPSLIKVLNLTGTVLHTNLGRAYLSNAAASAVQRIAMGASNLEFDLHEGKRGNRDSHVEGLLCELTGAQAAAVVNNNAAAVVLALSTLAQGREVCVSRGELVEIGGSFRLPEIMGKAGCELREVGTTNRTHPKDFEQAISERTAALMKVHTSNYEVQGFTAEVALADLSRIAGNHDLPCIVDLGSGTLVDLTEYGLAHEPTVRETLESGADLVTFSGDKLLGGPQAGILVGSAELIDRVKSNPLKRALRTDKMTLAALETVLAAYRNPETLADEVPTIGFLARTEDDILQVVDELLTEVASALDQSARVHKVRCESQIGSGALPLATLPSWALEITPVQGTESALQELVAKFRSLPTPVIGRVRDGSLLLDMRTLQDPELFTCQLPFLAS